MRKTKCAGVDKTSAFSDRFRTSLRVTRRVPDMNAVHCCVHATETQPARMHERRAQPLLGRSVEAALKNDYCGKLGQELVKITEKLQKDISESSRKGKQNV